MAQRSAQRKAQRKGRAREAEPTRKPSALRRHLSREGVHRRSSARREPDHVAAHQSLGLTTRVALAVVKFRRIRRNTLPPEVPQGFAVPAPRPLTPPPAVTPARPRKKGLRGSILAIGAELLAGLGVDFGGDLGRDSGSAPPSLKATRDAFLTP